jgi:branched-chain amino acid transport system permease protein
VRGGRPHPPPAASTGALIADPRPGRDLLLGVLLAVGLSGCANVDLLTRDTCLSILPALEPADTRLVVDAVETPDGRPDDIRLVYRAERDGASRAGEVVCSFGDDSRSGDRRGLLAVRDARGALGPARLYFLKRFWLGDQTLVGEALARVEVAAAARPRGLTTLSRGPALVLQRAIDATVPAALYALLGLACSLVWGLLGRVNFAFGDIATLGAFSALVTAVGVEAAGIGGPGLVVGLAILAAVAVTGLWGAVLGRIVYRPLAFRAGWPLLVATVGLSIALQEFVARSQGARERFLPPMLNRPWLVADGPLTVTVTPMRVVVAGLAVTLVVLVLVVWPKTRFGRDWRAVADDRRMASLLGVDPTRVLVATFALSAGLAAVAGAILTLAFGGTSFSMGTLYGLEAVVAAILGGVGSLPGAALGGLLLGLGETVWSSVFGDEWRHVAVLALLAATLIFRPTGLFGTPAALEEDDCDR